MVNGYLHTPYVLNVIDPATRQSYRAVQITKNIVTRAEGLMLPKDSWVFIDEKNAMQVFRPGEAMPEGLDKGLEKAIFPEGTDLLDALLSARRIEPEVPAGVKPWTGKDRYDAQSDFARDLDAYYEGKSDFHYYDVFKRKEVLLYEIPAGSHIIYAPVGRAPRVLVPGKDKLSFCPGQNDGQLMDKAAPDFLLNSGIWKPLP